MKENISRSDQELLNRATAIIEINISTPRLNGDLLCRELGISKSILYARLKNLTNQTVNEFIRVIRLKKSTCLLLEGEFNISQISVELGFNSPSYFARSFRQYYGTSPKKYIVKHRIDTE